MFTLPSAITADADNACVGGGDVDEDVVDVLVGTARQPGNLVKWRCSHALGVETSGAPSEEYKRQRPLLLDLVND